MRGIRIGAAVLGLMLGSSGVANPAQVQQTPMPQGRPPLGAENLPPIGQDLPAGQREKQEKMQNDERQKQLVLDASKLLQLANELHTDVSKTDKNILSVDVIKKADEIEKLAHSVKVKMRGGN